MAEHRFSLELATPNAVGLPLCLFGPNFAMSCTNVHDAVAKTMGTVWRQTTLRQVANFVTSHVRSEQIRTKMVEYGLKDDECMAIVYYTIDISRFGEPQRENLYRALNTNLAKRDTKNLEPWQDYLFLLLSALNKLPNFSGEVFRGLKEEITSLSKLYQQHNNVCWVALTSTTKNQKTALGFGTGTLFSIKILEGKDISQFSMFSDEGEVVLLPNSVCSVVEVLTPSMKALLGRDALVLQQIPTTDHFQIVSGNSSKQEGQKEKKSENREEMKEKEEKEEKKEKKEKEKEKEEKGEDQNNAKKVDKEVDWKEDITVVHWKHRKEEMENTMEEETNEDRQECYMVWTTKTITLQTKLVGYSNNVVRALEIYENIPKITKAVCLVRYSLDGFKIIKCYGREEVFSAVCSLIMQLDSVILDLQTDLGKKEKQEQEKEKEKKKKKK
jgi:hypothetical protein